MFQKIRNTKWFVPVLLFFFALVSFGIYIPRLGLFGDDWIYLYSYHVSGSSGFPAFVSYDRPYSAWIYQLTSFFFQEKVWMYHTFLLLLRWFSGVLCWLILKELWPKQHRQTAAIAVIFSIFPAFLQQAISLEFILHFTVLDACLLSFYLMMLSIKHQKYALWYTIAAVLLVSCHFSLEYFVGLELARPVVLYFYMKQNSADNKISLGKVFMRWLPYLSMVILFGIWRVFIFKFPSYKPHFMNDLVTQPAVALTNLGDRIIADAKIVFFSAWKQVIQLPAGKTSRSYWLLVLGAFVVAIAALFMLKRVKSKVLFSGIKLESWPVAAILTGMFLFLISGWPFWVADVPLEVAFPWDRTLLSFMLASSFWVVGLVDLLIRPSLQPVVLAGLLAFSVSFHYFNARVYDREHEAIRQYFSQLSWRIPELKDGTVLLTQDLPLFRESDNDLGGTLNWAFAPEKRSTQLSYLFYDFTSREPSALPVIEKDQPVNHSIRSLDFSSTTSEILTVYWNGSDCVWMLFNGDYLPAGIPALLRDYVVLSEPDQILATDNSERVLPAVFDGEADHGWCYLYEKAALARQSMDWKEVVRLAGEATQQGYSAENGFEALPFLEAYLMTGDYEMAYDVSEKIQNKLDYSNAVCDLWSKIDDSTLDFASESILTTIHSDFNCNP